MKLVGVQVAVSPVAGETVLESVRVPVKPFKLVRVTVEAPEVATGKVTVDGEAVMLKSGGAMTLTAIVTVWERVPLVPVMVTV